MSAVAVSRNRSKGQPSLARPLLYLVITAGAIIFMLPFLFALTSSLKTPQELRVFPPAFLPAVPQWNNYPSLFELANIPYGTWYVNSVIITLSATVGTVLSASASAYGFSRFRWPGRDVMFTVLLATLILPEFVVLIPRFLMFHLIPTALTGQTLIDTWWPLILPSWFGGGAFAVFLLRQFFLQLPRELDEAALIDGANSVSIFWQILLPLSKARAGDGGHLRLPGELERLHRAADLHHDDQQVSPLGWPALVAAESLRSDDSAGSPADGGLGPDGSSTGAHLLRDAALLHPGRRDERDQGIGVGG